MAKMAVNTYTVGIFYFAKKFTEQKFIWVAEQFFKSNAFETLMSHIGLQTCYSKLYIYNCMHCTSTNAHDSHFDR